MSSEAPNGSSTGSEVVTIDYNDLLRDDCDLSEAIEKAYGFNGLGVLSVKNVPGVTEKRKNLLPLAHRFAGLPEDVKKKTIHEESFYSFGWSHGKEMLEGKPDYSKGSYYNNPQYDRPFDDEELIKKHPAFCHPNIWPKDDLPELEHAFKDLGQLIVHVGTLIGKHCDTLVQKKCPTYPELKLHNIIKTSRTCKARLLHYFPLTEDQIKALNNGDQSNDANAVSSWCGWHNDHGSLTGLTPAMYIDAEGKEVPNPDPKSGLYIRSRSGELVKVAIPADHLIFQIGETAQIHSGGLLQATPHCVRGAQGEKSIGVSRETFAVFMEPMWAEPMNVPQGVAPEEATKGSTSQFLPPGVPTLASRWKNEYTFDEFTSATLKSYY